MRELTQKEESSLYSICLDMGLEVSYGKLSICDLSYHRHSHITKNRRWQVHCDDNRNPFSGLFDDKLDAIEKFMEIKPSVKPRTR
jgi:hypothetical protein